MGRRRFRLLPKLSRADDIVCSELSNHSRVGRRGRTAGFMIRDWICLGIRVGWMIKGEMGRRQNKGAERKGIDGEVEGWAGRVPGHVSLGQRIY